MERITEIKRLLSQRPLMLPAIIAVITCISSYLTGSVIPSVVISLCLIAAGAIFLKAEPALLICIALSAVTIIYMGLTISLRLNSRPDKTGNGTYLCRVVKAEYRSDGSAEYRCLLEGGAYAVMYSEAGLAGGDMLRVGGNLTEPDKPGNPGEFDFTDHLRRQGICYVLWPDSIEVTDRGSGPDILTGIVWDTVYALRQRFLDEFSRGDADIRALASALFTGDTSLLSDDSIRCFRLTNCSHLLAVSGTHFAGFLLIIPHALKALKVKKRLAAAAFTACAFAIGMFTGWSDSVTRAFVMSACSFASRDGPSGMSLAVLIMLVADPFAAMGTGFQLSFAAACAILLYLSSVQDKLIGLGMSETFAGLIAPALTVTAAMLPFCAVTGIRLHPFVLAVQIVCSLIVQTACMFIIPGFALGINTPAIFCLRLLEKVTGTGAAAVTSAGIGSAEPGGLLTAVCVLVLVLLLPQCFAKRHLTGPVCLILALCLGVRAARFICRPAALVVFADVGQGDCCLIITDDKTCLIDAGVYDEGAGTVRDILDHYGIASVDYAFMSHWDADHAGGIIALYEQGRIKTLYSGFNGRDEDVEALFDAVGFPEELEEEFLDGCVETVVAGDEFELDTGVLLKIIAPVRAEGGGNEDSLVMTLEAGGETVLFTGDIGTETEEQLVLSGVLPDCDVLKVAHHGSKYSTSDLFLAEVSPEIAVISVGKNNFYGHPTPECLARLASAGCNVLRTDTEGAVVISLG